MLASRSVTTTGHGSVALPRDAAVLDVAAVHRGATLSEALAGAESARAAVVSVVRERAAAATVSTQGLQTYPHHHRDGAPSGFEARHALQVRCGGLDDAAGLLQALADGLGDRLSVDGVRLVASPTADHLASAREAAYADARARGEHLARLAGASLGNVVAVVEGGALGGPVMPVAVTDKAEVGFEGGADDVTTSVTVTWEVG